jgi:alkylation response protein AidB-like acyl-CoA dehydrogenase
VRFDLSEEQELFRDTTRRFLLSETPLTGIRDKWESVHGFDRQWWSRAAALGWTSLLVSEDSGGGCLSGLPASDAAIVAEEIGRTVGPGPFLPVSLTAFAIDGYGTAAQKADLLPSLLTGESVATWAFAEAGDVWDASALSTRIETDGDSVVINGRKSYVEAVGSADWLLVTARSGMGLSNVVVPADARGVDITPGRSVDMVRRFGTVGFADVRLPRDAVVGPIDGAAEAMDRMLALAVILQCAQINGAAGELFAQTIEYAKGRYAFGRPIAAYQAIKHRIADLLQRLEFARAIADAAALAFDKGQADARELATIAKAYVPDVGLDVVDDCVQISGGIGVTWEHDAHVFSRRVALDRALYGAPEFHKEALVDGLGLVSCR